MTMFCGLLLSTWLLLPFPIAAHEAFIAPQHMPFLYHAATGSVSYRRGRTCTNSAQLDSSVNSLTNVRGLCVVTKRDPMSLRAKSSSET